ncbi:MAG: hypothetical protein QGG55_07265, partial [Verrucomicrobiota bacterium]|nr:hypothetical protein [Verrucomicrobiota bacterium]
MRIWIGMLALLVAGALTAAPMGKAVATLFQESCIKCHGKDGKVKGKVDLLKIRSTADLTADLEELQTLIEVLDTREMPPESEPELKPAARVAAMKELRELLHTAATAE